MSNDVIAAFTQEQVQSLTGLTTGQLRHWEKIGFFVPGHAAESARSPYSRIYSFKDVVGLRTIAVLMGKHGVSMHHLKKVAEKLSAYSAAPWSEIKLKVWKREVQFDEPETGRTRGVVDGQYVLLEIIDVIEDMRRDAAAMRERKSDQVGKIEKHRYVNHNQAVIAGTRISVGAIQRLAEDGFSPDQIIAEYPRLTKADVSAALKHQTAMAA
ncbi:DUF433 domain-containing protein [Brevundimonas variabilis]|uniref:Uncharacterized protein (DUF433 family) n=1 Tax=Brevundimonas variabilis TaxID=74312 RepID=A0A7W9FCQ5_9CAUL|nr:DUF433 domain-containing protein [Brevundimonas variabilis]MBB5744656.1 uncharacterized protein (DUF433 family) [Brevundimonas variabilis]